MRCARILTLVSVICGFALVAPAQAAPSNASATAKSDRVPGEIIVKMKAGPGLLNKALIHSTLKSALGNVSVLEVRDFKTDPSMHTVKVAQDKGLNNALKMLQANPNVEYAEPNYIYRAFDTGVPNDADFGRLWGMQNTGQPDSTAQVGVAGNDIDVLPLWQRGITGSKDVLVAIIDTGIQWDHPDLQDNVYTNPGEIAGDGIDNDGNGFIDDVHGWNFFAHNNNSSDDHDHGSHCAGTIGGVGNNGLGVAGVNWNVSLLPVKFLGADGSGSAESAIEGINYARLMGAKVMSNSWGGGSESQALKDAIIAARDAGILFVAAAGNDASNNDSRPSYPASYDVDNVVSVAAMDNRGMLAGFSNYGKNTVDVAAPGVNIWSSVKGGGYASFSGTSMATPHVAGIAALLMAGNNTLDYKEVKRRLIATSEPVPSLSRRILSKGRVSALNAFDNIVPPSTDPDESLWVDEANSTESDHPYASRTNQSFTISSPGARFIRVVFEKVETEDRYDKLFVQSPTGEVVDELTGSMTGYVSGSVAGDSMVLRLTSDGSINKWGFKVAKIQVVR